jgi:antitoxin (DNA-binding transcriptional repressor) of toxin-antitoxin stability system
LKTHAARILRQVREGRTSYLLTHRGRAIGVILPVDSEDEPLAAPDAVDATAAWEAFMRAGRRLERRFAAGASGVRHLSAMRR